MLVRMNDCHTVNKSQIMPNLPARMGFRASKAVRCAVQRSATYSAGERAAGQYLEQKVMRIIVVLNVRRGCEEKPAAAHGRLPCPLKTPAEEVYRPGNPPEEVAYVRVVSCSFCLPSVWCFHFRMFFFFFHKLRNEMEYLATVPKGRWHVSLGYEKEGRPKRVMRQDNSLVSRVILFFKVRCSKKLARPLSRLFLPRC